MENPRIFLVGKVMDTYTPETFANCVLHLGLARTTKFLHFVVVLVCGKVAEMNDVISSGDREANRQAVRERENTEDDGPGSILPRTMSTSGGQENDGAEEEEDNERHEAFGEMI